MNITFENTWASEYNIDTITITLSAMILNRMGYNSVPPILAL